MLTARQNDLEYQAQQISQQRLSLAAKLDDISQEYETAVSNRQMIIAMQDSDGTSVLSNLTYARLVSGAAALGTTSGLNQVEGVNTSDNSNSQAFRLVMGDTIVVSDVSEIPGKISATYSDIASEKDEDLGVNLYVQKLIDQVKRIASIDDIATLELQNLRAQLTAIIGDLGDQQQTFVEKLAWASDLKGQYKRSHSKECAELSREICNELKLNEKTTDLVYYAGLLQNIGKITLSEEIFNKKEKLTQEEWEQLKKSPNAGVDLLMNINFMPDVLRIKS